MVRSQGLLVYLNVALIWGYELLYQAVLTDVVLGNYIASLEKLGTDPYCSWQI